MEDEVVVGFVPPYPPYNGFQAGLKPASTDVTTGRGEGRSPSYELSAHSHRVGDPGLVRGMRWRWAQPTLRPVLSNQVAVRPANLAPMAKAFSQSTGNTVR